MKKIIYLLVPFMMVLTACDQKGSVDSTKLRAQAEQEAGKDVENRNLQEKAQKMETDLADRHYFYKAIEGQYQGTAQFENQTYNIKFNFVRSLPQYLGDRVRQLSEIENDLNNLSFNIQVIQWHPEDTSTAVGCRVVNIRPDMQRGVITITSPDCPNLYTVMLNDLVPDKSSGVSEKAKGMAEKIKNKEIVAVDGLVGTIQPTSNANLFSFSVRRMNQGGL